ncbi:hypothetical protein GGX14DRAFT_575707 [Mycena pura]|uniref:Uncharacterized protein n=1 Tax=Mycena pura TaxID=153505 RepID=A0AAD6UUY6_9AGAR|nr:hypothetical protein GGX14DRAFT_575707 [Mycena pura]
MVKTIAAFMDFCYLVRRNAISASDLTDIKNALARFHRYRKIFIATGVRIDISLPRQHALVHYNTLLGSPNGSAVAERGMLTGTTSSYTARVLAGEQPQVAPAAACAAPALDDEDDDDGTVHGPKYLSDIQMAPTARIAGYPKTFEALALHINQCRFPVLFRRLLYEEVNGIPDDDTTCPDRGLPGFRGTYQRASLSNRPFPRPERYRWGGWDVPRAHPLQSPLAWSPAPRHGACRRGGGTTAIIPVDAIARASHLIGVYGPEILLTNAQLLPDSRGLVSPSSLCNPVFAILRFIGLTRGRDWVAAPKTLVWLSAMFYWFPALSFSSPICQFAFEIPLRRFSDCPCALLARRTARLAVVALKNAQSPLPIALESVQDIRLTTSGVFPPLSLPNRRSMAIKYPFNIAILADILSTSARATLAPHSVRLTPIALKVSTFVQLLATLIWPAVPPHRRFHDCNYAANCH